MLQQTPPSCPNCGRTMVLRTARRGVNAGRQFYGCPGYPNCQGIINLDQLPYNNENIIQNNFQPTNQTNRFVDLTTRQTKILFEKSFTIECKPKNPSSQVRVFENIWAPSLIVRSLNRKRKKIDRNHFSAFSQWRLDFPHQKEPLNPAFIPPLSVLEKILLRGSIIPCSPFIEKELSFNSESVDPFFKYLQNVNRHPRIPFFPEQFDSEHEQFFFSKISQISFGYEKILPWVSTQVPASNLSDNSIDPNAKQRVDFLFCHPASENFVVEIDGPQHESSKEADQRRDLLLSSNGLPVLRIPTSSLENKDSPLPAPLQQKLSGFLDAEIFNLVQNPVLEEILLIKSLFQFQIALLEAVKGGWLDVSSGSHWKIQISFPAWVNDSIKWERFFQIALSDFLLLLSKTFLLHNDIPLELSSEILFNKKNDQADLFISYNPFSEKEFKKSGPLFSVSDVHLPFRIAQSIPPSNLKFIENPSKEIAQFFLQYLFDKEKFHEGQWEAIERTLKGKDSIVLLPTGGGKTIAFQLASFLLPGICLVIDPLIALINDQVDNLRDYGIDRAVGITSQLSLDDRNLALDFFKKGQFIFCYVAPERLQMEDFRASLRAVTVYTPINVIVIDEAHCVSEWGHDFRVSYLNIARNSRNYAKKDGITPPLLGLTGTASRSVLRDVRRELEILDFDSVITPESFDRENLHFRILECKSVEKFDRLIGVLTSLPQTFGTTINNFFRPAGEQSKTGLIFFPHVNGDFGILSGYNLIREKFGDFVGLYSGKSPKEVPDDSWQEIKSLFADDFKNNEKTVLSCTNAFGMGIDKSNIRYTVHMNLPRSIEAFYQEAGRAGRDCDPAECIIIVSHDFPNRTRDLLDPSKPLEQVSLSTEAVPFGESDDITRQLFFHVNSFKGTQKEFNEVKKMIDLFGDLQEEKKHKIPYTNDESERTTVEKAIHRLVIIGVIKDYTINYSSKEFEVFVSGNPPDVNLESYIRYLENYDRKFAEQARKVASEKLSLPHQEFVLFLAEKLIKEFIYNIIELSRRRSLNEMLQACITNPTDEGIRSRILSYLELGHFSEILENLREHTENLPSVLLEIFNELDSPMEANELRGQTARMLEAYPNNPAFLLIRSLAEAFCPDRNPDIVFENFNAFLSFSTSESGWGMETAKVINTASTFINQIGETHPHLAQDLVVATLESFSNDPVIARLLLKEVREEFSLFPAFFLLNHLSQEISQFIKS